MFSCYYRTIIQQQLRLWFFSLGKPLNLNEEILCTVAKMGIAESKYCGVIYTEILALNENHSIYNVVV